MGFIVAIAIAFWAAFIVISIDEDSAQTARRHNLETRLASHCGPKGIQYYDVQDKNLLVYACNSNHILHTHPY